MNEALIKILKEAKVVADIPRKNSFIEAAIILLEEEIKKTKPPVQLSNPYMTTKDTYQFTKKDSMPLKTSWHQ